MAHQLDFQVIVYCDSYEALVRLKRYLSISQTTSLALGCPLFSLVDDYARAGELSEFQVEVSSLDINEDTESVGFPMPIK